MPKLSCTATAHYQVDFDTDDQDSIIRLADKMARDRGVGGLDSWDLGDAMGEFIFHADAHYSDEDSMGSDLILSDEGFSVVIQRNFENFQWTPPVHD